MPPSAETTDAPPTHFRWVVFALACSTSWMLYLHRYTLSLIKPYLAEEFDLTKEQLGWLDSISNLFYTFLQIPLGLLGDLFGAHAILVWLIVIWSLGLGMNAWAGSLAAITASRVVFGSGQSAVYAMLNRVSRTWFPASVRSSMQGLVAVFAGRVGGFSANILVGSVMLGLLHLGWRTTLTVLAGFGLLLAAVFGVLFRDSPRQHPSVNDAEAALIEGTKPGELPPPLPPRMTRREVLDGTSPRSLFNLSALSVQSILSTLADNVYSNWIPLFLFDVHKLKFEKLGIYSALPLLGGAIGGMIGGFLMDGLIARTGNRRWSRTAVGLAGKGIAGVLLFAAVAFTYDNPQAFCLMLFWVKLFSDWSLTATWSTVTDIGGRATATVFALTNTIAGIASILAPLLYGYVAQHYDWKTVFTITWATYGLCALSWLAIDCTIPVLREKRPDDDAGISP
jgi:MFS transporter, ACS family, glucarate transporter